MDTGSSHTVRGRPNGRFSSLIGKGLRSAVKPSLDAKPHFVPVSAISKHLTEDAISRELKRYPSDKTSSNANRWAAIITTPDEGSETGTKRIFGLFSMIERPDLVEGFIARKLDDRILPFTQDQMPFDESDDAHPCEYEFLREDLEPSHIQSLLDNQWLFLVPVFRQRTPESGPVEDLHDNIVFPFYES